MGLLRTLLALLVVIAHLSILDKSLITKFNEGATLAVKVFFLLSGFYMSLVLDKKYPRDIAAFYWSRFVRIFPLYWATCLVMIVLAVLIPASKHYLSDTADQFARLDALWAQIAIVVSNLTLFGSDLLTFIYVDVQTFSRITLFPKDPIAQSTNLGFMMVDPPAWTLGIEVLFYALAPFVFRKGWFGILALIAISITSRMFLFAIGYHQYDWSRHFVLSEGVYFGLGMASYRLYMKLPATVFTLQNMRLSALVAFVWTVMYSYIVILNVEVGDRQIWAFLYHWWFMMVMVALVPFIFELTRKSQFDFYAGELSYPIYITHFISLWFVIPLFQPLMNDFSYYAKIAWCLIVVVAVAATSILLITNPIERRRGRASMEARHRTAGTSFTGAG